MISDRLTTKIAWCGFGEPNDEGCRKVGGSKKPLYMFRALHSHLRNLMYDVIRKRTIMANHQPPCVFLMNEALRQARKTAVKRADKQVNKDAYRDKTSRMHLYFTSDMYGDDLANSPEATGALYVCTDHNLHYNRF